MTHVVTGRCVDCRYTYCVVECPVTCFWEIKDPHMLVIDPNVCIDCEACVPACPINAIWPDHELPAEYAEWEQQNADTWESGTNFTDGGDPLDTARLLEEIQEEEKAKGWDIAEPSKAAD
jgi:ferredoxin